MDVKALRILIIEDEISLQLELEMMLDEMEYDVIGIVNHSEKALEIIQDQKPDLILMDIDIKGELSGIEIADKIVALNIPILFITSDDNKEMYESAKISKLTLTAYMAKPVSRATLESTLDLIVRKINISKAKQPLDSTDTVDSVNFKDSLFIKNKKRYHKILFANIQIVAAEGNYTNLFVGKKKYLSSLSFTEIEKILPPSLFIKVHRSYLMNYNHFESIDTLGNVIHMQNGIKIPISRIKKRAILKLIQLG